MGGVVKRVLLGLCGALVVGGGVAGWWMVRDGGVAQPIRVGILHSLTGVEAACELPVVNATLVAIDEINRRGGVLGRQIEVVSADGGSDDMQFARQAERLIAQERVVVVFGGGGASNRRTIKPVFEKHRHLLIYPANSEGLDASKHVVYMGTIPNQQVIPAVSWAFQRLGKRFFVVGSDYIYSRAVSAIVKDYVGILGGEMVGEHYFALGTKDVKGVVRKVVAAKPTVIINTISGRTNKPFFAQLRAAGISTERVPTLSFSLSEIELHQFGPENMSGDYAAWSYFQSLPSRPNQAFLSQLARRQGRDGLVANDSMESAYFGVLVWAQTVQKSGTADVATVRRAIHGQTFEAPHGIVHVDHHNNGTWEPARIGKIRQDGQFDVVWSSNSPVWPKPYPSSRTPKQWQAFLQNLHKQWHGRWHGPTAYEASKK
ncbi:MAG: urea ABC transporter substrate-binding protein [Myxococcota bacterium]